MIDINFWDVFFSLIVIFAIVMAYKFLDGILGRKPEPKKVIPTKNWRR